MPELWPIYEVKSDAQIDLPKKRKVPDGAGDDDVVYKYSNGKIAPPDIRLDELPEEKLVDRFVSSNFDDRARFLGLLFDLWKRTVYVIIGFKVKTVLLFF